MTTFDLIATYPIFVAQEDLGEVTSVITISACDKNLQRDLGGQSVFVIANGVIHFSGKDLTPSIQVTHTWAKDEQGEPVKVALFEVSDLSQKSVHEDGTIKFSAWLNSARYYPVGEENQFTDAIEEDSNSSSNSYIDADSYLNTGYAAEPAEVELVATSFPIYVEIELKFGAQHQLNKLVEGFQDR